MSPDSHIFYSFAPLTTAEMFVLMQRQEENAYVTKDFTKLKFHFNENIFWL